MTGPTLTALILAQARNRPDAPAVQQWDRRLPYRDLVTRAAALAARLCRDGAGPEDRVGICTRRTPDSVVAVLGVLLSGAAYVPLDLAHPRRRSLDTIADAGIRLVVADTAGTGLLGDSGARYVPVPDLADAAPVDLATVPAGPARPANVAHVLYTSGSTGRPKGVLNTHANIVAFALGCREWTGGVGPEMRSFGIASLTFDAATVDLLVPLTAGGSVQLVGDDDRADPVRLQRFAASHRVTWGLITPAVLPLLDPDGLPDLAVVMSGGDVVPPEQVERWSRGGRRFFDIYGPTEATVGQVAKQVSGHWQEPLPIGQPLPGQRVYVCDERGQLVGEEVDGELYLGGAGLARGYLHRPGLTAWRFVPDPFSGEPGARLYRTGDIVRRRADGDLMYVGRRDGQVKVRGQRIELGEIEAVLRGHPAVADAAVVATPGPEGPQLVAFVAPDRAPEADTLRAATAERLTAAMVPRWFHRLAALPLAPSGKVDRARLRTLAAELAAANGEGAGGEGAGGEGAGGEDLRTVWRQVLGGAAPGDDQDFFAAGGSSIAAMRLVAAVRATLRRDISVEDVFHGRTLGGLSRRVRTAAPLDAPELTCGNPPALTAVQRRMWFLDKLAPRLAAYNIVFAERLRGRLDLVVLRRALAVLAERQSVLRWRIPDRDGEPYAACDPPGPVPLPVIDLDPADLPAALASVASSGFDLPRGPLWTAQVYCLGTDDYVLVLAFHHAIMDGWSQAQLYADLSRAYRAVQADPESTLPALPAGYADYVAWLDARDGRAGDADRRWWAGYLTGVPAVLDLPRDRPRPPVQTYAGRLASVPLGPRLDSALRRLAGHTGATAPQVVLAGLAQALRRLTGQADLVIGVVTADRWLAAMQHVVGMFVDVVPVRLRVDDDAGFQDAVRRCRDDYLAATAHPAATLEQLVGDLGLPRDASRAPLVQVLFNAYDFPDATLDLPEVAAAAVPVPPPGSPFDLTVYLLERDGQLALDLLYNRDLYDHDRIVRFGGDLVTLLGELVDHPDRPAGQAVTTFRTDGVTTTAAVPPAPTPAGVAAAAPGATPPRAQAGDDPATATERLVADVWRSVLGVDAVRATDNFFDVGGHSLALVTVQQRLADLLGRELPVVTLFHYPSVRALAAHLDGDTDRPELSRAAQVAAARRARTRRRRPT
jgi:mycobactin peptide synthetase MbtE